MSNEYVFEMRDITKAFNRNVVLDGVSISIRPGEVRALIGKMVRESHIDENSWGYIQCGFWINLYAGKGSFHTMCGRCQKVWCKFYSSGNYQYS